MKEQPKPDVAPPAPVMGELQLNFSGPVTPELKQIFPALIFAVCGARSTAEILEGPTASSIVIKGSQKDLEQLSEAIANKTWENDAMIQHLMKGYQLLQEANRKRLGSI